MIDWTLHDNTSKMYQHLGKIFLLTEADHLWDGEGHHLTLIRQVLARFVPFTWCRCHYFTWSMILTFITLTTGIPEIKESQSKKVMCTIFDIMVFMSNLFCYYFYLFGNIHCRLFFYSDYNLRCLFIVTSDTFITTVFF